MKKFFNGLDQEDSERELYEILTWEDEIAEVLTKIDFFLEEPAVNNPINDFIRHQDLQSAFTCNRDEIHPGTKKILFTREFDLEMKRVEFHPRMKLNLRKPPIEYENI